MNLARGPVRARPRVTRDSRTLTDAQLRALLDAAAAPARRELARGLSHGPRQRDLLLLQVAAGAGLRASELSRLRVADVGEAVTVRGGKLRRGYEAEAVPLAPELSVALRSWCHGLAADAPVFSHRDDPAKPIDRREIWYRFKVLAARAGLPAVANVHSLRHWFATSLVKSGRSLAVVARMTRHRRTDTVLEYFHDVEAQRAAAVRLPGGLRLRFPKRKRSQP